MFVCIVLSYTVKCEWTMCVILKLREKWRQFSSSVLTEVNGERRNRNDEATALLSCVQAGSACAGRSSQLIMVELLCLQIAKKICLLDAFISPGR